MTGMIGKTKCVSTKLSRIKNKTKKGEQMTTKEKVLNIHQRLNAIMGDVDYIKKNKSIKIGGGGYSVVDHDSVTALIHPLLVRYGVTLIPSVKEVLQEGNRTSVKMEFSWINIDDPKDCIINFCAGYGIDQQDKGIGKAISYAQKNIILKTLHIETGERDIEEDDIDFSNESIIPSLTLSEADQVELKEFVLDKGIPITDAVEIFKEHGYSKSAEIPKNQLGKIKTAIVEQANKEVAHA
tara:strand:- start:2302 stop:3018 length:717 start_codon:yes stop_codon:yes gene_type:complete